MAQRYIYLSEELNKKLKEENNASGLIQELLLEHYRKLDPNQMTPEEIRTEITRRKLEKEYKEKLEKINNGKF